MPPPTERGTCLNSAFDYFKEQHTTVPDMRLITFLIKNEDGGSPHFVVDDGKCIVDRSSPVYDGASGRWCTRVYSWYYWDLIKYAHGDDHDLQIQRLDSEQVVVLKEYALLAHERGEAVSLWTYFTTARLILALWDDTLPDPDLAVMRRLMGNKTLVGKRATVVL
tara:strand:+ start:312 stop:806 length:495 start_codon:yes stop_codon:yes gene_type:complete